VTRLKTHGLLVLLAGAALSVILLPPTYANAADSTFVRGKITYISGDAIYTSLGRKAGVTDSSLVFILGTSDTIGTMRIYATSSQSSAAKVIQTKRPVKIDDIVAAWVVVPKVEKETADSISSRDSSASINLKRTDSTAAIKAARHAGESLVKVRGRIGLQYYTNVDNVYGQSYTQPGIVFNLRGKFANSPISFETYGNIRQLIRGSSSPFASNGTSQTRVNKMSIEYDDSTYKVALGRLSPMYAPSLGYIDGGLFMGKISCLSLGLTAGYEPSFLQNSFSSTLKKFALFGNYQTTDAMRINLTGAYALTLHSNQIDREVASSSFSASLTPEIFVTAQGDVDFRTKSRQNLIFSPRITSLFANVNYRITSAFTAGIGYNAYRPVYSFASIQALPDSFIDNTLRSSLSVNGQIYLPGGISFYNTYTPRSADQGFGKEYLNNTSFSVMNIMNSGATFRATLNLSSTVLTSSRGIGANLQKTFANMFDVTVRYQTYRNETKIFNDQFTTQSFAVDLMSNLTGRLNAWASIERLTGSGTNSYNIYSELSWSF
jgi:hypothetical protein